MIKIYLVYSARVHVYYKDKNTTKYGEVYNVVEAVFTNRRKAEALKKWAEKTYKPSLETYEFIRFFVIEYGIAQYDYTEKLKQKGWL